MATSQARGGQERGGQECLTLNQCVIPKPRAFASGVRDLARIAATLWSVLIRRVLVFAITKSVWEPDDD